jgi:hypothetical protein
MNAAQRTMGGYRIVGWVERSETHHCSCHVLDVGLFNLSPTYETDLVNKNLSRPMIA